MKKQIAIFLLMIAAALIGEEILAQDQSGGRQQLADLVTETLASNPEIDADEARWQILTHKARQAGAWEDPMLMLRAQNVLIREPLAFDRDPMTAKVIGVSQMVPYFGKRRLQRDAARQDAEEARWQLEERKIELTRMVREKWFQLLYVDSSLEIVEKNIAVLDDLTRLSETLYGVGQGLQQDVLKAQVERSKMEEMRISLRQQRRSLVAFLNSLRARPPELPIVPADRLELTPLAAAAAQLEELAVNRALFKGIDAREQSAVASRELADREYYPDFTFTLEYMQREESMGDPGYDMYTAGVTFNLPIRRDRRQAMAAEATAEIRMAQAEREMARNQIRLAIADTLARLDRNNNLADLYRLGIIPQADLAVEAALASYRAGRADFMNVLDSRMSLFNFEREYTETVMEHQMQLAELEALVGSPLF